MEVLILGVNTLYMLSACILVACKGLSVCVCHAAMYAVLIKMAMVIANLSYGGP